MGLGFRIPSITKRIAVRLSIKRHIRHSLGLKAPREMGWITDPKRALYNRIYSRTTRGCMLYLIIFLACLTFLLVGCNLEPKRSRAGGPVYVSPSVDSRGRVRKGYIRMPVSANKNAVRNQGKWRYYYETRGRYRRR